MPNRRAWAFSFLTFLLFVGTGAAQVQLTQFQTGDPIVADEVNANFEALGAAIEQLQQRLDAVQSGVARVSAVDLVPLYTVDLQGSGNSLDYVVQDAKVGTLSLVGQAVDAGTYCFGTSLDLPDGGSIIGLSANGFDAVGSDATVTLLRRAWGFEATEELAGIDRGTSDDFSDALASIEAPGSALPHVVDAVGYAYRLDVCLSGPNAGFLDAAIDYDLP